MDTKISPLVLNRCSDLSDIHNYRPVAIANVSSIKFLKIFCSTDVNNIYLLLIIYLSLNRAVLQIYIPYGNKF